MEGLKGSGVQGGTAAGKVIWREFMFPYLDGSPVAEFTRIPLTSAKST